MGLLLYRLLWVMNTEKFETTNFQIARMLLKYYDDIRHLSIGEMADLCVVSKSTLSKFAKTIGFESYIDLKDASGFIENRFNFDLNYLTNIVTPVKEKGPEAYFEAVEKDIRIFQTNVDISLIDQLAQDLMKYEEVAAFGLLFSGNAALDLQGKLAYNKKFIYTTMDDIKQEEYISKAGENTLIIIFSNSGRYITQHQLSEAHIKKKVFKKTRAKIVLITSNEEMKNHEDVDLCIFFQHATSIQTHSFLYQIVMDLIVSRYRQFKEMDGI